MHIDLGVLRYSLVIAALVIIAYAGTFSVPFIFDDNINIVENRSIRNLSSIFHVLAPPFGTGVAGRPIVNFSLALNYAISGENPWSYHLLNLLIHLSAAFCLFGIVRRSFLSESLKGNYGDVATPLAFSCALLWALHPLQTQAVTYTIQRCESLMGLCFLLTFYFAIRGWKSVAPRQWHLAAILSFLVGIGTKEVMIIAPVLLFVYDILFFHGDPKNAINRSPLLYAGLSFGLLCLGLLVTAGGTASSGTGRITFSALDYWVTQPEVILHYLRLAFWPNRLCIDYGWPITRLQDAWPSISIIAMLLIVSLWALIKRYPIGYLAAWFFAVLAPTSLIPMPDAAFEHRMYLPLIAVVVIMVTGVYKSLDSAVKRWIENEARRNVIRRKGSLYLLILTAVSLGILTYARNIDYGSDISIWAEAVREYPENSRAHANLGNAFLQDGRIQNALEHLYVALRIETENARRYAGALTYDEYLRIRPVYAKVQDNLGWAWLQKGNAAVAILHLQEALKANPCYATAFSHMGIALHLQGKQSGAMDYFQRAIRLNPFDPDIHVNLGATLRLQGKPFEAVEQFREALRLMPRKASAHYGIGMVLMQQGEKREAISHFREALRLNPNYGPAKEIMEQLRNDEKMGQISS